MPVVALIKLLIRKWWIFALVGLVSGSAGFLYATFQKPKFESRLTFSLDAGSADGTLSGAMNLAAQFGLGLGSGAGMFDGDNIVEIMKSRRMVESVLLSADTLGGKYTTLVDFFLDKSGLRNAYDKKEHLRGIRFVPGVKKQALSYLQDSLLHNVYLTIAKEYLVAGRPDKKLGIYEVKVTSMDERFSKVFTDRLVEVTGDFYTEITSKKDRETLEILEQRVSALKGNVSESIESRAGSQDANVNPAFAKAQVPAMRQQYNMQAYGEAYKEMFKTLEMARYQYLKKIPLLQIIDPADYPMRKIKTGRLKAALYASVVSLLITAIILMLFKNYRKPIED